MPQPRIAIFPGSFDPVTNGHVDLIQRAARLFDQIIVAVLINPDKRSLFGADERVMMITEACAGFTGENRVKAEAFEGLLVDFAERRGACAIVRGLRTARDFDYERPMSSMNAHLAPAIDTVFLAAADRYTHVSSSLVKDVANHGGSVDDWLPAGVAAQLKARLAGRRESRS